MITKEEQSSGLLEDTNNQGSVFRLCSGENLCPDLSEDCGFKAEICVVNPNLSQSKIRYDTIHK